MDFILENLALGNAAEAVTPPATITALLCVAQEVNLVPQGLPFHKVPIVDMQPIPEAQLYEAVTWLRDHLSEHRVLVFCNAGVGRSTSVVIGYLCVILNYGFGDAVEWVARKRPYTSILPNLILTIDHVRDALTKIEVSIIQP